MKKCFLLLFLSISSLFANQVLIQERVTLGIDVFKIEFENHTYIYFRNTWNSAGSAWFHDPECEKCKLKKTE